MEQNLLKKESKIQVNLNDMEDKDETFSVHTWSHVLFWNQRFARLQKKQQTSDQVEGNE